MRNALLYVAEQGCKWRVDAGALARQAADATAGRELLERHGPREDGPALLMDHACEDDATREIALIIDALPVA